MVVFDLWSPSMKYTGVATLLLERGARAKVGFSISNY